MRKRKQNYKGSKEITLLKGKYPVTRAGKLSCKRVRAAESYGSKQGVLKKLKSAGLCKYVKKCKIKDSKVCTH